MNSVNGFGGVNAVDKAQDDHLHNVQSHPFGDQNVDILNYLGNQNPALPGVEDTVGMNLPRELQHAGSFFGSMTNAGSVSTLIPALEVKTEYFTETCDESNVNQCY